MGGVGSGGGYQWWRPTKKRTVEGCRQLDGFRMAHAGILRADAHDFGSWSWYLDSELKKKTASIDYEVNTTGPNSWLRLSYTIKDDKSSINYRVELATTRPHFGGLRWWFLCPLLVNGRGCGRRVAKLYLPSGGRYFGCRHCYDLTYKSVQEHDARVDALRRNPAALELLLSDTSARGPGSMLLALKALR
jgi:hypothetical protein